MNGIGGVGGGAMMLAAADVELAVDLHARSYRLLLWLETALQRGIVSPHTAAEAASREDAAVHWISRYLPCLPPDARPEAAHLEAFCRLFSTWLECSFDFAEKPGEYLYSDGGHCFCPWCSVLLRRNHLTPRKVDRSAKKAAVAMQRAFVENLAMKLGIVLPGARLDALLDAPELRETLALCAYGADLLDRLRGFAGGAATLALWRTFAWTPQGSPKKGFVLRASAILDAQAILCERLAAAARGQ